MEGDDRQPAALSEQLERVVQPPAEHVELVIDGDADRLKSLAGGMSVAANALRNILLNDLRKLKGGRDGLFLTGGNDALGYRGRVFFLAVFGDYPAKLLMVSS